MELIPAIDIQGGRCVRLYQGDFAQTTVYDADPRAVALRWAAQGAQRLHIVDLDGARAGHPVNSDLIVAIVRAVRVPVQLGGGLRSEPAVRAALELGVERVVLGTAAIEQPELVARLAARYGEAIVVAVDARDGLVATDGWTESAPVRAVELIEQVEQLSVRRFIYTDITRNGTLTAPDYTGIAALTRPGGPAVVVSGGICQIAHLHQLAELGVEAAIVGRALYTGDLQLASALEALAS